MKKILLLFMMIPTLVVSQELPYNDDGLVVYEKILDYPNLSKPEIHKYSRKWVDDTFNQSSEVIQSEDQSEGELIGTGYSKSDLTHVIRISMIPNEYIGFKFSISSRDGKSRIRFYSVELTDEYLKGISVEAIDRSYRNKKSTKTVDAWINRVSELNSVFDGLIDMYNHGIMKYSKDNF